MARVQEWLAMQDAGGPVAAEAALLRAARAGDRAALEQLLAPHREPLLALCGGMLGQSDDAEDAAQETFLRALRALPRFRGEAAFRTWLFRIAVNTCLNWKRDCRLAEPLEEARLPPPESASPEALALLRLELQEALAVLKPHQRAALLLKEREGWSVSEIGEVLHWNRKRVENELYRSRLALVKWRRAREEGEAR